MGACGRRRFEPQLASDLLSTKQSLSSTICLSKLERLARLLLNALPGHSFCNIFHVRALFDEVCVCCVLCVCVPTDYPLFLADFVLTFYKRHVIAICTCGVSADVIHTYIHTYIHTHTHILTSDPPQTNFCLDIPMPPYAEATAIHSLTECRRVLGLVQITDGRKRVGRKRATSGDIGCWSTDCHIGIV